MAVYGCVGLLADSVATLPTLLLNGPDIATSKPIRGGSPLLDQPYAEISRVDWWTQFIWGLALRGNFFGRIIERDSELWPVQIQPIPAERVQLRRIPGTGALEYRYFGQVVPIDDVFHVRNQSMPGMAIGLNPIEVCGLTFGIALAQSRYQEAFFLNSADPRGVIEMPGDLDVNEAKAWVKSWLSAHQGLNQAHLPAVLTQGAKFNPISISPVDAQLLQALEFSEEQIVGRVYRVPVHMVGMVDKVSSWGRGIEQQERGFNTNTLAPYYRKGAEALNAITRPGQYVVFDLRERLKSSTLERAQTGSLGMLAGYMVADDARELVDLAPLPDGQGQIPMVGLNMQLLQAQLQQIQQSQQSQNEPQGDGSGGNS